ncbi:unnamed protein product [Amoebophrya sp. A25]|nr:unnamed protein product [Amoebophrya sp. A25]|eukprot:GSA25T00020651001.1
MHVSILEQPSHRWSSSSSSIFYERDSLGDEALHLFDSSCWDDFIAFTTIWGRALFDVIWCYKELKFVFTTVCFRVSFFEY